MTMCKYCKSHAVKWKNMAKEGDPAKWELWDYDEFGFKRKHDCGFKGFSNCNQCEEPIRWKEVFCTIDGYKFKPYDHTKDKIHTCKWKHIKKIPYDKRFPYFKTKKSIGD